MTPGRLSFVFAAALLFAALPATAQDSTRTADSTAKSDTSVATSAATDSVRAAAQDSATAQPGANTAPKRTAKPATPPKPAGPVWPVKGPEPLPGSILPTHRIVAFYGNPLAKGMGILGKLPPDRMLAKLDSEVAKWNAADSATPAIPALHLIAVVAQADSGRDGKYRLRMDSAVIEKVYGWAHEHGALLFLDVQVGRSTLQEELPALERFLSRPDVHLGIDPEFSMKGDKKPGRVIGSFDAKDVNYASDFLEQLVTKDSLPPKILVVHRFTRPMLRHSDRITLDPRVQIVIDMDGWGPPSLKRDSYRAYVYRYPVQFAGFKLFYRNDTRGGHELMTPAQVLALHPKPLYIQYQ